MAENKEPVAVQTEEVEVGDVIPNWGMRGESATVREVKANSKSVLVTTDTTPKRVRLMLGRTITVLR